MAYKQFQDGGLSRFPEIVQWETSSAEPSAAFQPINATHHAAIRPSDSLMNTPTLWVANISAWRRSVFPRSKLMDLLNMRLEFPIHSLASCRTFTSALVRDVIMQVGHSQHLWSELRSMCIPCHLNRGQDMSRKLWGVG